MSIALKINPPSFDHLSDEEVASIITAYVIILAERGYEVRAERSPDWGQTIHIRKLGYFSQYVEYA